MLTRTLMLTTALVAVIPFTHATAGGTGGGFRVPKVNCPQGSPGVSHDWSGGGHNWGGSSGHNWSGGGTNVTNNINRSTNVFTNHSLNVYSPVNVTNNIDNSSNVSANVNINNSKLIDMSSNINNSTNINVEKNISVSTTNIFNGLIGASGGSHSQGGSWGSYSGGWGGGGCGSSCGGGSNQNSNSNSNDNSNSNTNSNGNGNYFNNNGANIYASGAVDSFFNGLRGLQN